MGYTKDRRVDSYIDALPDWQQAFCREVRDIVHSADPDVVETIKFRDRPYFVLDGNVCALLAAKQHVNVFLYDGAIVPAPRESSPADTRTRPPGESRSGRARRSTRLR